MCKKILIVDDNELILEVMSYILTNNGYDVSLLNTGDYVVDEVKSTHPDLLILDDICKALKNDKDTENMPVIICSGMDDIEDALMQAGAPNDILRKPFDMTALIKKVQFQLAA
jgi:DNA-binding response OmpR family regulator